MSGAIWPVDVASRIQAFLREHRTGQIVITVNDGTITGGSFHETWRRQSRKTLDRSVEDGVRLDQVGA